MLLAGPGVWNQLLDTVIDDPDFEWLMIDASYIRVHPNGTGTHGSNQVCQNRDVLPGNLPNPSTRHLDQAILTTRPWEFLEIPGDKDLVTVVAFGYPADWVAAGAKVRDILSETAHNERVGQTYEG